MLEDGATVFDPSHQIQQMDDVAVVTFELHDIPNVTGRRTLILHGATGDGESHICTRRMSRRRP